LQLLLNRRYLRLIQFFGTLAIQVIFWEIILRGLGLGAIVRRTRRKRYKGSAKRFRELAVQMGGVLIKVGQFLSARVDILPEYIVQELAGLQDEVPAEDFTAIKQVIEDQYGKPLGNKFKEIDENALAAASLGQVHRATLFTGEEVVVKVLRPDIEQIVKIDLAAMATAIGWLKYWKTVSKRADVVALLKEFSTTLYEELDYVAEAENAMRFAEMFKDDEGVKIPKLYPELSTKRVLVLEDVMHIKITDYDAITAEGIDRADVAIRLLRTYLYQIFTAGFFHADPHPGNLFVEPLGPNANPDQKVNGDVRVKEDSASINDEKEKRQWRLVFVDFGMVGRVGPEAKQAGREMILALATRDAKRMVQAYITLGALLPGTDLTRLIEAETILFDKLWGKSMEELRNIEPREFHDLAHQFSDLMYEMPFQIPANIIYLGRCVAILSGICTGLNPDFNLFLELIPFAEQLMAQEVKDEGIEFWLNEIVEYGKKIILLPNRLNRLIDELEHGEIMVNIRIEQQQARLMENLNRSVDRFYAGMVFAALLGSGTVLYLFNEHVLGIVGWGLSSVPLLWAIAKRR
jgi:predicted unusual protein kinase regulating ubiquinone biosynthesis (AarF/ABC1/UbiB family)